MKMKLEQLAEKAALSFNHLNLHHPVTQRLPLVWRDGAQPIHPPPLKLLRNPTSRLEKLALRSSPTYETVTPFIVSPWNWDLRDKCRNFKVNFRPPGVDILEAAADHGRLSRDLETSETHLVVYCAAFEEDGDVGAGVVGFLGGRMKFRHEYGLGREAHRWDGELLSLTQAACESTQLVEDDFESPIDSISIFTTNHSAIQRVISASASAGQDLSNQFRDEVSDFLDADNHRHLTLSWIPFDLTI